MARPTYKDIQRYKEDNIRFMQENRHEEGVQELPCGVQFKIITAGRGTMPSQKSMVKVHYRGSLIDGTVFDDSFARKKPASFRVNEVIKGWQEALKAMPSGSLRVRLRNTGLRRGYSSLFYLNIRSRTARCSLKKADILLFQLANNSYKI